MHTLYHVVFTALSASTNLYRVTSCVSIHETFAVKGKSLRGVAKGRAYKTLVWLDASNTALNTLQFCIGFALKCECTKVFP